MHLDWYPHLKEEIQDVFNLKVSLSDIARELEKDLLIVEDEEDHFKISLKKEVIPGFESNLVLDGGSGIVTQTVSKEEDPDSSFFSPQEKKKVALSVRNRT